MKDHGIKTVILCGTSAQRVGLPNGLGSADPRGEQHVRVIKGQGADEVDLREAVDGRWGNAWRAAEALGIARQTLQNRLKRAAERGLLGYKPVLPGFRISRTATTFDGNGNLKAEPIQQKPELGPEFEMPAAQIIKGISALVDADGREIQKWIKTKTDTLTPDMIVALKEVFEGYQGRAELIEPPAHVDWDIMNTLSDLVVQFR